MPEQFISEAIRPAGDSFEAARMATGAPGLPPAFVWRGRTFEISQVRRTWRQTGKCRLGSPERYVRRYWFEVATISGEILRIDFDRQPRSGKKEARWWLFSIATEN